MAEKINMPQPTWLRVLSNIVSYIFHPVFMPLGMALVLHLLSPVSFTGVPPKQLTMWFLSIGLTTLFFPLFTIILLKGLNFIDSIHLRTAKERIIPLIATMIYYFWVTHVFNNIGNVPLILRVLMLGNFWGVIAVFMINIFTKISLHTTAAGGMIGIIIVLMMISPVNLVLPFFGAIIIAGMVGTARSVLGAHYPGDIWLGYIIGILVQLGAYWYLK